MSSNAELTEREQRAIDVLPADTDVPIYVVYEIVKGVTVHSVRDDGTVHLFEPSWKLHQRLGSLISQLRSKGYDVRPGHLKRTLRLVTAG